MYRLLGSLGFKVFKLRGRPTLNTIIDQEVGLHEDYPIHCMLW